MKKLKDFRNCSVGRSLMILGDKWIFLILREAFFGVRYYDQFQANLGISTNILSARLKTLVENQIMKKVKDERDARRSQYRFTQKGLELYWVVLGLMRWGDKWLADESGPPLLLTHKPCGHRLEPEIHCGHCGQEVMAVDIEYEENPASKEC